MTLSTMSEAELRSAAIEGLQAQRARIDEQIAELYARNGLRVLGKRRGRAPTPTKCPKCRFPCPSAGEAKAHCVRKRGA